MACLLDDVARRCSSGESLAHAFAASSHVAAMAPRFDQTTSALHRGTTLAEALQGQHADDGSAAVALHVLTLCARVGGNVSEPLDRAAAVLRERHAAIQERIVQSTQARLSAKVLTALPIGFSSWTILTSREARQFALTTPGLVCLCAGLSLNLLGWRVMTRIIRGTQ